VCKILPYDCAAFDEEMKNNLKLKKVIRFISVWPSILTTILIILIALVEWFIQRKIPDYFNILTFIIIFSCVIQNISLWFLIINDRIFHKYDRMRVSIVLNYRSMERFNKKYRKK
jgi:hypothetical protein